MVIIIRRSLPVWANILFDYSITAALRAIKKPRREARLKFASNHGKAFQKSSDRISAVPILSSSSLPISLNVAFIFVTSLSRVMLLF
jgi:hypothetical protein